MGGDVISSFNRVIAVKKREDEAFDDGLDASADDGRLGLDGAQEPRVQKSRLWIITTCVLIGPIIGVTMFDNGPTSLLKANCGPGPGSTGLYGDH